MFLCDTLEGSHPRANVNGSPEFQGGYSQQTLAMATNRKAKARTNFGETRINSRSSRAFCLPESSRLRFLGYRTFGVSFGAVFCCVGAVVRVLKLGWPGFMGGQKVCLGSGFFVVVPRDKSV